MRKNIYNGFEEHKHFGRLIDYLEIDRTYQDYKKGIKPKDIAEEFGVLHSGDVEWALNELERLNNIINEIEEDLKNEIKEYKKAGYDILEIRRANLWLTGCYDEDKEILNKIKELKEEK